MWVLREVVQMPKQTYCKISNSLILSHTWDIAFKQNCKNKFLKFFWFHQNSIFIILKVLIPILENVNKVHRLDPEQQKNLRNGVSTVSYFALSHVCFGTPLLVKPTSRKNFVQLIFCSTSFYMPFTTYFYLFWDWRYFV